MPAKSFVKPRYLLVGTYLALRYYAAFTLMSYGFAKVMGAQFTILDSQLARPLGEVSGFWLTWYYFGYSPAYAAVVAWLQIGGALLLCLSRTALVGTLVLLPVVVNIVCIDRWIIGWSWDSDALRNAVYVLFALLGVLAFHSRELAGFLSACRNRFACFPRHRSLATGLQILALAAMLG